MIFKMFCYKLIFTNELTFMNFEAWIHLAEIIHYNAHNDTAIDKFSSTTSAVPVTHWLAAAFFTALKSLKKSF